MDYLQFVSYSVSIYSECGGCKGCSFAFASRLELLNHYKLKHPHFGRTIPYPCTYVECPCTFKTWNALIVHQSRIHSTQVSNTQKELCTFSCHLSNCKNLANDRDYFIHIDTHLRRNETVCCMFVGCSFKTNVYGTFKSNKSRHHTPHTVTDFIPGIVKTTTLKSPSVNDSFSDSQDEECVEEEVSDTSLVCNSQHKELPTVIEQQLAAALLKLEYLVLLMNFCKNSAT